jgi:uroporphyrinogen-III synthase
MGPVVLTQPQPRVAALAAQLRLAGHHPIVCSFAELVPDAAELERLASTRWEDYERVLLTSPSAVEFLLVALERRMPAGIRLGVVGPGSLQALRDGLTSGGAVDVIHPPGPPYDADALLALPQLADLGGRRVMVLRGKRGRNDWIETLAARGASLDVRILYASRPIEPANEARQELIELSQRAAPAVFVVTTSESAQQLDNWAASGGFGAWARGQRALTVHRRIAEVLAGLGWNTITVVAPGENALQAALESA